MSTHTQKSIVTIFIAFMALAGLSVAVSFDLTKVVPAGGNAHALIAVQIALTLAGLVISMLLAWRLIATTRLQTAHFRFASQLAEALEMADEEAQVSEVVEQAMAETLRPGHPGSPARPRPDRALGR